MLCPFFPRGAFKSFPLVCPLACCRARRGTAHQRRRAGELSSWRRAVGGVDQYLTGDLVSSFLKLEVHGKPLFSWYNRSEDDSVWYFHRCRYTAAAIASIAYKEPTGLVDGNVIRVLARMRVIGCDTKSSAATDTFWWVGVHGSVSLDVHVGSTVYGRISMNEQRNVILCFVSVVNTV